MTQWGLDVLFNPSKRHMDEEKRRLQATRPVIGDNSGGKRIDLESGKVRISGKKAPIAEQDAAEAVASEAVATEPVATEAAATEPATTEPDATEAVLPKAVAIETDADEDRRS